MFSRRHPNSMRSVFRISISVGVETLITDDLGAWLEPEEPWTFCCRLLATSAEANDNEELRLSRKYFEGMKASDDWERIKGSVFGRPSRHATLAEDFAPNANISLNVGIIKRPNWVYVTIAVTGVTLQAGVIILAGVGVWILEWNLSTGGAPALRNYAPVMFIFGTVAMCAGMWACAYLIGQTVAIGGNFQL
ncbi:hypothetical protein B0J13DRAFT_614484 [Dactylonectria estremocensis]|uniref:Uncharacterized protein n=1 Tax=Dactylonectria estremocensis TaxID=1079267 RepID=A0A9P9CYP4_9HYPO|nr:hypothetical protein B0J13DRAFT_614484 [Dactylonectria estremocensis]